MTHVITAKALAVRAVRAHCHNCLVHAYCINRYGLCQRGTYKTRISLDFHVSRCSAAILFLADASERDVPLICVYVAISLYMTHKQNFQLMRGCV